MVYNELTKIILTVVYFYDFLTILVLERKVEIFIILFIVNRNSILCELKEKSLQKIYNMAQEIPSSVDR